MNRHSGFQKAVMRIYFLGLLLATSLLLAGCWNRIEINDLALVMGTAIDQAENNRVEITVQVFIPKSTGSTSSGMSSGSTSTSGVPLIRSGVGATLVEAVEKLQQKLPRKFFLGHCQAFIFGEALAKKGIHEHVDYLMRDTSPREHTFMFVGKGKAKSYLQLNPPLENTTADVLRELSSIPGFYGVTLKDLAHMLANESGNVSLPYIQVLPPQNKKNKRNTIGYIVGTSVFQKDKMVGILNEDLSHGFYWIIEKPVDSIYTVSLPPSKGMVSLRLLKNHTKISPQITQQKWSTLVTITAQFEVAQNSTPVDIIKSATAIKKIEHEINQMLAKQVKETIHDTQKMKADILGFAEKFHQKYPKEWKQAEPNWNRIFSEMAIDVRVHSLIRRTGMSNVNQPISGKGVQSK